MEGGVGSLLSLHLLHEFKMFAHCFRSPSSPCSQRLDLSVMEQPKAWGGLPGVEVVEISFDDVLEAVWGCDWSSDFVADELERTEEGSSSAIMAR